jgi:hypothetical protein
MPGNTVLINNSKDYEWYVGDSKMDALMEWLETNGMKNETDDNVSEMPIRKMYLLDKWIEDLIFPGKTEDFIQVLKHYNNEDEEFREFNFYTDEHRYRILAIDRKTSDGYLGCQATARKMRAGEDWERGNDLPDGPFNEQTWNEILRSIIRYEVVQLSEYKKPDYIPEEIKEE